MQSAEAVSQWVKLISESFGYILNKKLHLPFPLSLGMGVPVRKKGKETTGKYGQKMILKRGTFVYSERERLNCVGENR